MAKTLIIAEKPSVMTDLARVLGKTLGKFSKRGQGRNVYYENDSAAIISAIGHLVELRMPTGPNGKKLPWNFDVLPAIPTQFALDPVEKTSARLKQIIKLAKDKKVTEIVNACDAGREGELIFRYIMDYGGIDKPIKRLWMQSMTPAAITEAWKNLRSGEQMQALADAAYCRSESDWLVGLNATRALTCFRSRHGGFNVTAAGRVQTPTLAILAKREEEIQAFVSEDYFEVHADFSVTAGEYSGKWTDENWKKDSEQPKRKADQIWDRAQAEEILARCEGKTGLVEEKTKPSKQATPRLYDLTTLQREAPFSAKGTLSLAQTLYERHKMITYPRTDSRYLPDDYFATVRNTLEEIASSNLEVAEFANKVLNNKDGAKLAKHRHIFNTAKVSDHFAIIPTGRVVKLNEAETKLYEMIVRRFIAVFFPHALYEKTTRITRIATGDISDAFYTRGRVLIEPGWLAVYGRRPGIASGKDELVAAKTGDEAQAEKVTIHDEQTKPPARFTESTLLSAMEGAGKLIDDEALAEAMSERGLGTPATRAAIIEGLIRQKYIVRDGDGGRAPLHVTPNGLRLISIVNDMDIKGLSSPEMTGEWEYKLRRMEQGELSRDRFMVDIKDYTQEIVSKAKGLVKTLKSQSFADLDCPCPKCQQSPLRQTDATYECYNPECDFRIKKYIATRLLTPEEAKTLLTTKFVGPLQGFMSRFNRPFEAGLELSDTFKTNFVFENDDREKISDLKEDQLLGSYPILDGEKTKIYATEKAWFLPEVKTKKDPEGLRIGKTILQKEIPDEEFFLLIEKGKTNLLKGFISNRTKRPFDAYLTFTPKTGKIGFEFPPRPPRKKAAKKKTE